MKYKDLRDFIAQLEQNIASSELATAEDQLSALQAQTPDDPQLVQYQRQLAEAYLQRSQIVLQKGDVNAAATALSRADVRSAITALAKIVREEMLSGRTVDLANLGSFKVVSNGKRVETEKAVTAETLKTPRIQFFPKLEMRNQAKNVQHVVIRESEAGSAKPSPNPGDLPEAPDSAL